MSSNDAAALHARAQAGDLEAKYLLGRLHAGQEQFSRARRYLREAADAGHAGAITELGLFALFGIGMPPDIALALETLERAERQGSGEASYQLALMGWCDSYVAFDPKRIAERLRIAAQRAHPPALRAAALMLASAGAESGLIEHCLARAVLGGDAVAAYLLGLRWRVHAPGQARALLRAASERGITRAGVLADSIDAPHQAPKLEPGDITLPELTLAARPLPAPRVHISSPLVETYDEVYSVEECEYIIALGEPQVAKSVVMNDVTGELTRNTHRTSSDHSFYTFEEDFGLRWLQWRMLQLLGVPMQNAEHLDLLRYLPGEEYKPHRDYLPPTAPGMKPFPDQPGQRVHTIFSYLCDVARGGETEFLLLGIRIAPQRGRVVHFVNVLADGEPDARTLHAGLPVIEGTKWLATLWTRQRRYRDY
jgi:hypothetical protein